MSKTDAFIFKYQWVALITFIILFILSCFDVDKKIQIAIGMNVWAITNLIINHNNKKELFNGN